MYENSPHHSLDILGSSLVGNWRMHPGYGWNGIHEGEYCFVFCIVDVLSMLCDVSRKVQTKNEVHKAWYTQNNHLSYGQHCEFVQEIFMGKDFPFNFSESYLNDLLPAMKICRTITNMKSIYVFNVLQLVIGYCLYFLWY